MISACKYVSASKRNKWTRLFSNMCNLLGVLFFLCFRSKLKRGAIVVWEVCLQTVFSVTVVRRVFGAINWLQEKEEMTTNKKNKTFVALEENRHA